MELIHTLIPVGFDGESTTASEGDPSGSGEPTSGTSDDGSGGGTDASADALAQAQEELRSAQSARDRLRNEVTELEARKAAASQTTESGEAEQPLTRADLVRFFEERERKASHAATMAAKATELQAKFPNADEGIFERADRYSSVESLEARAKASHEAVNAKVEAAVQAKLREADEKYGTKLAAPVDAGQAPSGDPSLDQLKAMSMDEFDQVDPAVVERVLRSAEQGR